MKTEWFSIIKYIYILSLIVSTTRQPYSVSLNKSANEAKVKAMTILFLLMISPLFNCPHHQENHTHLILCFAEVLKPMSFFVFHHESLQYHTTAPADCLK